MRTIHVTAKPFFLVAILAALISLPTFGAAQAYVRAAAGNGGPLVTSTADAARADSLPSAGVARRGFQANPFAFAPAAAVGTRRTVCAVSLKVRGGTPPGYYIGELDRGETFLLVREGNVWAYGFAYGRVNKWGYVMKKYLC